MPAGRVSRYVSSGKDRRPGRRDDLDLRVEREEGGRELRLAKAGGAEVSAERCDRADGREGRCSRGLRDRSERPRARVECGQILVREQRPERRTLAERRSRQLGHFEEGDIRVRERLATVLRAHDPGSAREQCGVAAERIQLADSLSERRWSDEQGGVHGVFRGAWARSLRNRRKLSSRCPFEAQPLDTPQLMWDARPLRVAQPAVSGL